MMFTSTITIFNQKLNSETGYDVYHKTVLSEAYWEASQGIKVGTINLTTDATIEVVIPMSTEGFMLPNDYQSAESVVGKWTLASGDYIVKGDVDAITKVSDLESYDRKMVITGLEINDQSKIKYLHNYTVVGK